MKFLEGKSQKEKNKLILAIVLGILAVSSLTYTLSGFFVSGKKSITVNAKQTPSPDRTTDQPQPLSQADIDSYWLTTPVSYNPSAFWASEPTRNIFAFYEPPPSEPFQPTPTPTVEPPKPTPTPPLILTSITPQSVYAGSKSFKLQANGANFTSETYIFWNGIQLPTNFVNSQTLTADVPATLIVNEGVARIEVRSPDGSLYSTPLILNVQPPPRPQFKYVGLIARRSYNNDTAYFQEGDKQPFGARLNDVVGERFRVISISSKEVVLEDIYLGFRHRLAMTQSSSSGQQQQPPVYNPLPGFPPDAIYAPPPVNPTNPVNPVNTEVIPGIPPNIPRYVPPNQRKKQQEDEDDNEDGNR
jgi:hypothetical protein